MARRKPRSFRLSVRNTSVAGLFILAVSLLLWRNGSRNGLDIYPLLRAMDWDIRREEVKEVFVMSWDIYLKNAWD
jgi:hypothetical protein